MRRETDRQARIERAARARISSLGYLLRRELLTWIGEAKSQGEDFDEWIRDSKNAGTLFKATDLAVARGHEMMTLLAEAPDPLAHAVRSMYVHLLEGVRRLRDYSKMGRPFEGTDIFKWVDLRTAAENDLRDCLAQLENHVIEPALLNEELILKRRRDAEGFDATLKELVRRELEELDEEDRQKAAVEAPAPPAAGVRSLWWRRLLR